MSTGLQVRLFGRVSVLRHDRPVPVLASKAVELLCYLVLHRGRAHTREALARLLWPDAADSQAKKYLRQTLWQLQTSLASRAGPDDPPLLDLQAGRVRVSPTARWWCDVDLVEQAHHRCREVPAGDLLDHVAVLEQAVGLCQGDLLEGWCQDWCVRERDRLHLLHLELLERLTDHCVARRELARGLAHGNRLLQLDPAPPHEHQGQARSTVALIAQEFLDRDRAPILGLEAARVADVGSDSPKPGDRRGGSDREIDSPSRHFDSRRGRRQLALQERPLVLRIQQHRRAPPDGSRDETHFE